MLHGWYYNGDNGTIYIILIYSFIHLYIYTLYSVKYNNTATVCTRAAFPPLIEFRNSATQLGRTRFLPKMCVPYFRVLPSPEKSPLRKPRQVFRNAVYIPVICGRRRPFRNPFDASASGSGRKQPRGKVARHHARINTQTMQ